MVTKVTVDVTPPSAGKVYVGNVISTKYVTTDVITIHWQGFRDEESNIKEFGCAVMSENGEIVVDFQPASGSSITMQKNNKFTDGHSYRAIFKVILFSINQQCQYM